MERRVYGIILIAPDPDDAQEGKLFLIQPPSGRWTLPGGVVPAGHGDEETLIRHIDRQTGQLVEVLEQFGPVQVSGSLEVVGYLCTVVSGFLIETDEAPANDYVAVSEIPHLRIEGNSLSALGPVGRLVWDAITMFDPPYKIDEAGDAVEGHFLHETEPGYIVEIVKGQRLTWRRRDPFGPSGYMTAVTGL